MAVGYITPKDLQDPKDEIIVIQPKAQIIIDNARGVLANNLYQKMPDEVGPAPNFAQAVRYLCGRVPHNVPGVTRPIIPEPLTKETKAIYNEMHRIVCGSIDEFYEQIIEDGVLNSDRNKANYKQLLNKITAGWEQADKKLTMLGQKATGPLLTKIEQKLGTLKDEKDLTELENYITEVGLKDYYNEALVMKEPAAEKINSTKKALIVRTRELWEIVRATEHFYQLDRAIVVAAMGAKTLDYNVPKNMLEYFPESKPVKCSFSKAHSKHITNIKIVDCTDIKALLEKHDSVNYEDLNGNTVYLIGDREKIKVIEEKDSANKIGRE